MSITEALLQHAPLSYEDGVDEVAEIFQRTTQMLVEMADSFETLEDPESFATESGNVHLAMPDYFGDAMDFPYIMVNPFHQHAGLFTDDPFNKLIFVCCD